jgi:hypothetical protein
LQEMDEPRHGLLVSHLDDELRVVQLLQLGRHRKPEARPTAAQVNQLARMSAAFSCTVRSRLWPSIWMVFSVSLTVVRAYATVLLLAAGARRQRRAARVTLPSDGQHAHFWARGCTTWPLLPQHPHPSSLGV